MLTQYEARKLQDDMRREMEDTSGTLWKCAAGLFVVTLLALVGVGSGTPAENAAYASSRPAPGR